MSPTHQPGRAASRLRRKIAAATVCLSAMLASLVAASPANAEAIRSPGSRAKADKTPDFSACVGPASKAAGFEDIDGLGAEDAINCLAYYKIVIGKTPERFAPSDLVTRSQLALMLYRAARIAEIELKGTDISKFEDMADASQEKRNAVGALVRNKIMAGSSQNENLFAPDMPATRLEIVSAMVKMLRLADTDLFNRNGSIKLADRKIDYFKDSRDNLPRESDDLVSIAYELGLTTGSADDQSKFDPEGNLPRKNVSSFVTRMLSHTNVRPAGLTAQADGRTIVVSVRDSDFQPVRSRLIDGFYVPANDENKAFDNTGECTSVVRAVVTGTSECYISSSDPATDADGNANLTLSGAGGKDVTVWVWSDRSGASVDADVELYKINLEGLPVTATRLKVTPTQEDTYQPQFGTEFEFTAQLQGTVGGETANASVGTDGRNPSKYTLKIDTYVGRHTSVAAAKAAGLVSSPEPFNIQTNDQGEFTFVITASDPNPNTVGQYRTVVWALIPQENAPIGALEQYVVFTDSESVVTHVTPRNERPYVVVPSAGSTGTNVINVTVRDQHGNGMRNQSITLQSNLNVGGVTPSQLPSARVTDSAGTVRIAYTHTVTVPRIETITAVLNRPGVASNSCVTAEDICGTVEVIWAVPSRVASQPELSELVVLSAGTGEIVVDADTNTGTATPHMVRYDTNDVFKVNGQFVEYSVFVARVTQIVEDGSTARLSWDSYDPDDSSDVATWSLRTS